jgi:hypothetical protein
VTLDLSFKLFTGFYTWLKKPQFNDEF